MRCAGPTDDRPATNGRCVRSRRGRSAETRPDTYCSYVFDGERRGHRAVVIGLVVGLVVSACATSPTAAPIATTDPTSTPALSSATTVTVAPLTTSGPPAPTTPSTPPDPTTSAPATESSATAAPEPPPRVDPACPGVRCVTVTLTGDVLLHPELVEQARLDATPGSPTARDGLDFLPMLAAQRPWTEPADLAVCHLETPLAAADGPFLGWPEFSAPPQVLPALTALGYDACTTASNHTLDQGARGVDRTLDALDAAGLRHAGSARSAAEEATPVVLDTPGGRVGLVAATYDLNGHEPDARWRVDLLDTDAILDRARAARVAGAEVVLVALHAGTEYDREPNGDQEYLARTLLADPAVDLVYGHHAHVVQPIEKIGAKWAVFGLGNAIAAQRTSAPGVQDGLLVTVRFSRDASGAWSTAGIAWLPTHVDDGPPNRWCPADGTPDCEPADPAAAAAGASDTAEIVGSRGAVQDGAVRLPATG